MVFVCFFLEIRGPPHETKLPNLGNRTALLAVGPIERPGYKATAVFHTVNVIVLLSLSAISKNGKLQSVVFVAFSWEIADQLVDQFVLHEMNSRKINYELSNSQIKKLRVDTWTMFRRCWSWERGRRQL